MTKRQKDATLFWLRVKRDDGGVVVSIGDGTLRAPVPLDELIEIVKAYPVKEN